MWVTTDPDARRVVLTEERWRHVVDTHGELKGHRAVVLGAVSHPHERLQARKPGQEWFYGWSRRRSQWIRVVVHYEGDRGFIVPAFPRRSIP